jgi:hypothetical protein
MTTQKIENTKLTMLKYIHAALEPLVPDLDKIWMSKYFEASITRPNWNAKWKNLNEVKVGGINIKVFANSINGWNTVRELKFGVRVDKDGAIDIGKLAEKINVRRGDIDNIIALAEENERIRDERLDKRIANADILDKLVGEGLIGHIYEVTEMHDGFRVEMDLKDEYELRAFLKFKKDVEDSRNSEVTT